MINKLWALFYLLVIGFIIYIGFEIFITLQTATINYANSINF